MSTGITLIGDIDYCAGICLRLGFPGNLYYRPVNWQLGQAPPQHGEGGDGAGLPAATAPVAEGGELRPPLSHAAPPAPASVASPAAGPPGLPIRGDLEVSAPATEEAPQGPGGDLCIACQPPPAVGGVGSTSWSPSLRDYALEVEGKHFATRMQNTTASCMKLRADDAVRSSSTTFPGLGGLGSFGPTRLGGKSSSSPCPSPSGDDAAGRTSLATEWFDMASQASEKDTPSVHSLDQWPVDLGLAVPGLGKCAGLAGGAEPKHPYHDPRPPESLDADRVSSAEVVCGSTELDIIEQLEDYLCKIKLDEGDPRHEDIASLRLALAAAKAMSDQELCRRILANLVTLIKSIL